MLILCIVMGYLFLGMLFALVFLTRLIYKLDEGANGSSWLFKLTIFPGCVVFWPVLLKKYRDNKKRRA